MYCTKCGTEAEAGGAFCARCGSSLGQAPVGGVSSPSKAVTCESLLRDIEEGNLPNIDTNGETAAHDVCHLKFSECICDRAGRGTLYVTNKAAQFSNYGHWINWPLKSISSCDLVPSGFVLVLSDRPGIVCISTGNQICDKAATTLIQRLISESRATRGPDSPGRGEGERRVRGRVKWFNNQKGYGFAAVDSGPDVFLHYSMVRMDGFVSFQEGEQVEFEITEGARGPAASHITKIGMHEEQMPRIKGTVKWFDSKHGYGFISREGGADVFVHYSVIRMDGYKSLLEGDVVEFSVVQGVKGPEAMRVERVYSRPAPTPEPPRTGEASQKHANPQESQHEEGERRTQEGRTQTNNPKAQTEAKAQEAAPVAQVVASQVKSAFPKTVFEVYIDHLRVIHLGWEGTPRTDEVSSFLRGLILKGQIPNVEFDFHHVAPQTPRGSESTRRAPNAAFSVASFLKLSFPGTDFEVYSENPSVVHIAWKGRPDTDEVRSTLQRLRTEHMIPDVSLNFHHADAGKRSSSSESGAKDRTKSKAKVKAVSQEGPYEILGVKPGAPLAEITSAYRRLATLYHPDKVASLAPEYKEIAESKMKEINAAYEELQRQFR